MDASPPGPTAPHSSVPAPSGPGPVVTGPSSVAPPPTSSASLPVTQTAVADNKAHASATTVQAKQASIPGAMREKRNARMTATRHVTTARPASRGGMPSHNISTADHPIDVDAIKSEHDAPKSRLRPSPRPSAKRRMQDRDTDDDDDEGEEDEEQEEVLEIDYDEQSSDYEPKGKTKARRPPAKKTKRNKGDSEVDYDELSSDYEPKAKTKARRPPVKKPKRNKAESEVDYDEHSSDYEPKAKTKAPPPPVKKPKRHMGETCLACARGGHATECVCARRVKSCRPCIDAKRPCSFLKEQVATPDDHALPAFVRKLNENLTLVVEYLERIQDSLDTLQSLVSPPSEVDPQTSSATVASSAENVYGPPGFRPDAAGMAVSRGVGDEQSTSA
ncbi:hypothetical protein L226DRAFT_576708 [Lentinus tigrinus ALCF2SS1-7]|uniref:uncharacterized protein n=1 Tax=Lentinus tigrinus ALCF2SS1-7 TaxID=1328758 RepID=UPI001165DD2F|nr:hypothetical protein L226DRAFT_576708 [Lentinus tigrinus ALCF2SS1-7]